MNLMDYQLYIFDMDGTLSNTIEIHKEASKIACEEFNLRFDEDLFTRLVGIPSIEIFKEMFGSEDLAKKLSRRKRDLFLNLIKNYENVLYDDVLPTFKRLKENGKLIAIATSSHKEEANAILKPVLKYIEFISTTYETKPKPEPDVVLNVINHFKIDKSKVIFIGDTVYDWLCAVNARVKFKLIDREKRIHLKSLEEII